MSPTEQLRQAAKKGFTPLKIGSLTGFTLLETLITTVIIAVGMTALITAFSQGLFASADAAALRTATGLSQAKMEELEGAAFASIVNEARSPVAGFSGFDRQVVVTSSPGGTNANLKQVAVTVYWSIKGGELSTTLTSYLVNHP